MFDFLGYGGSADCTQALRGVRWRGHETGYNARFVNEDMACDCVR